MYVSCPPDQVINFLSSFLVLFGETPWTCFKFLPVLNFALPCEAAMALFEAVARTATQQLQA
jgi:hypothetical protein